MNKDAAAISLESFYQLPIDLCCAINLKDQYFVLANTAFENILGWKSNELIGKSMEEFVEKSHLDTVEKSFSKIKLGSKSVHFEIPFQCKNKQPRWIAWRGYADVKQQILFIIGRDITEYREIEHNLQDKIQLDKTTGILDRQTFLSLLDKELSSSFRYHYPTAIIILDIDDFNVYNKQYGFQKADNYLKLVAIALKSCLRRKTDVLARLGNDEFAVLLGHNDIEKASRVAEYLHANIEKLVSPTTSDHSQKQLTVSIGIATIQENTKSVVTQETLLETAYKALATSQRQGGNQINSLEAI